jgi:membrane-bound lytic murein transglycosylase B
MWMDRKTPALRIWILFFWIVMGLGVCAASETGEIAVPSSLWRTLLNAGISRKAVARCLGAGGGKIRLNLILKNLKHRERKEDYRSFLTKRSIEASRRFIRRYRGLLRHIARHYGVPQEIIVAILQVESALGKHQERYRVLDVYVSLSALTDSQVRRKVVRLALQHGFPLQSGDMSRRIRSKARWGVQSRFEELSASYLVRYGVT